MRVLNATEITRRATQAINDAKKAVKVKKKRCDQPLFDHGERIFIFSHIQKKMVVYSLTRALNNQKTIRQIPFNGKKTVPAALRKDLWSPFATITFPKGSGPIGLSVFQKLREYRKRHEHEWGDEITINPENGYFIPKKKRGQKICDQVANSVADIAYVVGRLRLKDPEDNTNQNKVDKSTGTTSESSVVVESDNPLLLSKPSPGGIGLVGEGKGLPVQIQWKDIRMTEYAESWSENVEHGVLPWSKNNRLDNHTKKIDDLTTHMKEREKLYQIREEMRRLKREKKMNRHTQAVTSVNENNGHDIPPINLDAKNHSSDERLLT